MAFDTVLAYYPANSGTVLCVDCAQGKFTPEELEDSEKFSVAFESTEIGAPPSCDACGEVIAGLEPTNETFDYLKEQAASHPDMVSVHARYKADEWTGFEYEAVTFGMDAGHTFAPHGYFIAGYRYTGTPEAIQWEDGVYSDEDEAKREAENAAESAARRDNDEQNEHEADLLAYYRGAVFSEGNDPGAVFSEGYDLRG